MSRADKDESWCDSWKKELAAIKFYQKGQIRHDPKLDPRWAKNSLYLACIFEYARECWFYKPEGSVPPKLWSSPWSEYLPFIERRIPYISLSTKERDRLLSNFQDYKAFELLNPLYASDLIEDVDFEHAIYSNDENGLSLYNCPIKGSNGSEEVLCFKVDFSRPRKEVEKEIFHWWNSSQIKQNFKANRSNQQGSGKGIFGDRLKDLARLRLMRELGRDETMRFARPIQEKQLSDSQNRAIEFRDSLLKRRLFEDFHTLMLSLKKENNHIKLK